MPKRTSQDKSERAMDKVKAAEHDVVSSVTRPEYIRSCAQAMDGEASWDPSWLGSRCICPSGTGTLEEYPRIGGMASNGAANRGG